MIGVVIRGLLESLVALTAFRWLPLGVACGAVGISMGALTLGNLVLSGYWTRLSYGAIQISPWIYVCAAVSSTFLYYAATSWALNRFGWVLLTTSIVGGVSGLVGPVMFMVFSEVTPTFSAGGLLEGFVLGIALWLGGRDAHSTVRLEES